MVSMSAFIAAGGMNTLLQHATNVDISEITADHEHSDEYFVDIKFRFTTEHPRPFFGEKDLQNTCDTHNTHGASAIPRKMVSIMSEEGAPTSHEVEVINGRSFDDGSGSPSSSTDEEFSTPKKNVTRDTMEELVYMPDEMWISRTVALSTILKKQEVVNTEEEGAATNVVSVSGAVRAVEPSNVSDTKNYNDASNKVQSELHPVRAGGNPPINTSRDDNEEHLAGHVGDVTISKFEEPPSSTEGTKTGTSSNVPGSSAISHTAPFRAAVSKIKRNFSRNAASSRARSANIDETRRVNDVRGNEAGNDATLLNAVKMEGEHVSEIQPIRAETVQEAHTIDAPGGGNPRDRAEARVGDERAGKPLGVLLKRGSNLARLVMRKVSSGDGRAARLGSRAGEETGEGSEEASRLNRIRSLFSMKSLEEATTRDTHGN